MKKLAKFFGICIGTAALTLGIGAGIQSKAAAPFPVAAGQRIDEAGQTVTGSWVFYQDLGWWYRYEDSQYPYDQWLSINDSWYFFKPDGYMQAESWKDNYYLGTSGAMLTDSYTPDGYRVDGSGKWMQGTWMQDGTGWWYAFADGSYPTGRWAKAGGRWFHFQADGYMSASQWIGDYYVGSDGGMLEATYTPDGYYVDASGKWDGQPKRSNSGDTGSNERGQTIAQAALAQIGVGQRCNDLASNALAAVGINWNGPAESFFNIGEVVPAEQAQPGDLAFYWDAGGNCTHIAVYIGNGQAVHGGWFGYGTEQYSVYMGTGPIFIRPI